MSQIWLLGWLIAYIKYISFHLSLCGVTYQIIFFPVSFGASNSSLEVKNNSLRKAENGNWQKQLISYLKHEIVVSYTQVCLRHHCSQKKPLHYHHHNHQSLNKTLIFKKIGSGDRVKMMYVKKYCVWNCIFISKLSLISIIQYLSYIIFSYIYIYIYVYIYICIYIYIYNIYICIYLCTCIYSYIYT